MRLIPHCLKDGGRARVGGRSEQLGTPDCLGPPTSPRRGVQCRSNFGAEACKHLFLHTRWFLVAVDVGGIASGFVYDAYPKTYDGQGARQTGPRFLGGLFVLGSRDTEALQEPIREARKEPARPNKQSSSET